jgi:hypothetical protein
MFNLKEVKSTFESDTYNFSSRLKHYINSSIADVNGDIDMTPMKRRYPKHKRLFTTHYL